jgi:hypothetical protein
VKKTSLLVKLIAGFFGIAVVVNLLGGMGKHASPPQSVNTASTQSAAVPASPQPAAATASPVVDAAAERAKNKALIDGVRRRLADSKERQKTHYASKERIRDIGDDHLKVTAIAISRGMSKLPEDQKQAAEAKALATQIAEHIREMYASSVEQVFVKSGMDAQVRAGGAGKSRLTVTYALMSQPLVYKFQNEVDMAAQAKKIGFTKVVYTNGFESSLGKSWTVDL